MKKMLLSLLSFGIFGASASAVVSCGPVTFESLMARTHPTDLYRGSFITALENWASPVSNQLEDSKILINVVDTLITGDQYDNFEGDLADQWGHNADSTEFYFHMRDERSDPGNVPTWVDINQNVQTSVKASDLFNTFRYIFNPNNLSANLFAWQSLIKGGDELADALSTLTTKPKIDEKKSAAIFGYDERFDKAAYPATSEPGIREAQEAKSNIYLDRFILAYNLTLNVEQAYERAINISSTEISIISSQLKAEHRKYNYDDLINESMKNGQILKIGDFTPTDDVVNTDVSYNVQIFLNNPSPYFEGVASFLAWAPMPDVSVDYLSTKQSGYNYGSKGPENIWYSGPYVVDTYLPQQTIKLVANDKYFAKDAVPIKTLLYSNTSGGDVSKPRMLFESGDLSSVQLSATDSSGWNKYIGKDYDFANPDDSQTSFEGTHFINVKNGSTFVLFFNFHNNMPNSEDTNQALALNSVRQFMAYHLNRSYLASYFSGPIDGGSKTSKTLRNIYTSKNTVTWEDSKSGVKYDYDAYVNDIYSGEFKKFTDVTDTEIKVDSPMELAGTEIKSNSYLDELKTIFSSMGIDTENNEEFDKKIQAWKEKFGFMNDGIDAYMENDMIGFQTFLVMDENGKQTINKDDDAAAKKYIHWIGKYDQEAQTEKMKLIVEKVKKDLMRQIGKDTIKLPWLMSGSNATTLNLKLNDTIGKFEALNIDYPGLTSPITFEKKVTVDAKEFTKEQNSGRFSLINGGWSPDWADAANFLNTLILGGAYNTHEGWASLFEKNDNNEIVLKEGFDTNKYADLLNRFKTFNTLAANGDQEGEAKKRNALLAQAEISGMMKSQFILPMYVNALDSVPMMSHLDSFSRSTQPFGQASYKFVGTKLHSHLLTSEQFKQNKQKFETEKMTYKAIYPRGHNGYNYKDKKE